MPDDFAGVLFILSQSLPVMLEFVVFLSQSQPVMLEFGVVMAQSPAVMLTL